MKALLIVDVQNDFLPTGSLPVKDGDQVVPIINKLIKKDFDFVIATKDWHPSGHLSFAANHPGKKPGETVRLGEIDQILWPVHCVQNSKGSQFAKELDISKVSHIVYKGTELAIDSYSTFYDNKHQKSTGLGEHLKEMNVTDVYIAGLATDYCVRYSVLDALNLGLNVYVIRDACRAVDPSVNNTVLDELKAKGAVIVDSKSIGKNDDK